MNSYFTYILFSNLKNKFYVGSTNNIQRRLVGHNSGQTKSTKSGVPWNLVYFKEFSEKIKSNRLEIQIKKRGIKRYLCDINESG